MGSAVPAGGPGLSRRQALSVLIAVVGTAVVAFVLEVPTLPLRSQYALATAFFAAVLWLTGGLPLPMTALLVPVVLVALGVYSNLGEALSGFSDPVVFLLLAGFGLAAALQARGLDRRVAYHVLARTTGTPARLVGAVMVVTALLSTVISNTATTAMMVPVAIGLIAEVTDVVPVAGSNGVGGTASPGTTAGSAGTQAGDADAASSAPDGGNQLVAARASNLQVAMVLGIAYAASIGGVATLVGSPPNAIVVGQLVALLDYRISFVQWLAVGVPVAVASLPVAWLVILRVFPPRVEDVSDARDRARSELAEAGPLNTRQRRTTLIFAATALLWVLGGLGSVFRGVLPAAWRVTLFGGAGESLLGTAGHQGILYFVVVGVAAIPALVASGAADLEEVLDIDWGTLLLLGGGISLADALVDTGATRWLADTLFALLGRPPMLVVLLVIVGMVVVAGELASNTAMAAILAPILIEVGPSYAAEIGTSGPTAAAFLAVIGGVAASFGFALPVATPPNAIAYGTGYVSRGQMLRAGTLLDLIAICIVAVVTYGLLLLVWPAVLP